MNMTIEHTPSARAQVVARRTYNRPTNDEGTIFETWAQTVDRVVNHQRWLWQRALGDVPLNDAQEQELTMLRDLMLTRQATVSGRTLWLGGTSVAKRREASQFNCSFGRIETINDTVDAFWLLLQGCGVGFEPITGNLNGFTRPAEVEIIRSQRHLLVEPKGRENNIETLTNEDGKTVWTISIGDSAEAWAKTIGKIMAQKAPFDIIRLDFRQIRPAGYRLKGYGWISSGDETFAKALEAVCNLMSKRAGKLLTRIDILDVLNWFGTTLSSRRAAEIALVPYGDPEWEEFATAKKDYWSTGNSQRGQSNNSLLFYTRPEKTELANIFQMMLDAGGSEPGFINAVSALKRAPWFKGCNPCAEILLGSKSFCNLVEVDLGKFNGREWELQMAMRIVARANYRQTCVNLNDGILQRSWHELNEFLRLCGVGVTGIVRWEHVDNAKGWQRLRIVAQEGAHSMADELGFPRAKAVTTIKPSGSLSKLMDTTEGLHRPLGRYIFNNINLSLHDPLVKLLKKSHYKVIPNPYDATTVLVTMPVEWEDVEFETDASGKAINFETAVTQLNRYKMVMDNYVDHNASVTISYSPDEVPEIVDWLYENWDTYVGVSFLIRADASKTAADLGYAYLPQEIVTKETYDTYVAQLLPFDIDGEVQKSNSKSVDQADLTVNTGDECATGACPIR